MIEVILAVSLGLIVTLSGFFLLDYLCICELDDEDTENMGICLLQVGAVAISNYIWFVLDDRGPLLKNKTFLVAFGFCLLVAGLILSSYTFYNGDNIREKKQEKRVKSLKKRLDSLKDMEKEIKKDSCIEPEKKEQVLKCIKVAKEAVRNEILNQKLYDTVKTLKDANNEESIDIQHELDVNDAMSKL